MLDLPYGEEQDWRIAFIDVETTGLIPGYHEMVDVGIVMADLEGKKIDTFFRRIMPEHPGRASNEALECNGFSVERWRESDAVPPEQAVGQIIDFYNQIVEDKNIIMFAYNVTFDHAFLDHLFRDANKDFRELHDYALDLPSMAWGLGFHDLHQSKMVDRLGVEDEPRASKGAKPWEHTGLTGAELNLRIYRALLDKRQESVTRES